jgi:hypothetical protein
LTILNRRINALLAHATEIVNAASIEYQRGRNLITRSDVEWDAIDVNSLVSPQDAAGRSILASTLFPHPTTASPAQLEIGLINLVALIKHRFSGIPPAYISKPRDPLSVFFKNHYYFYGGLSAIAPFLLPSTDAVCATLLLYLIESGANVAVGRTLSRECIESSDKETYARVTGSKAKARGKPIIVDLPEDSPAITAMRWLADAGAGIAATQRVDSDKMFLVRVGGEVRLVTPTIFRDWFTRFAANTEGLEELHLVPSMIRPSVLLKSALEDDGRLRTGLAIAQHGVAVSQGYQQKWPTRLIYDENIRRFGNTFEILVLSAVEDAAAKMGMTTAEFENRLEGLWDTGLGTFCKDRRGRSGQVGSSCKSLDCWNDCPHLLLVAEVNAIATLQLWQTSLREVQPEWERDRIERWEAIWLPWLCFADVVEEKMVRGPLLKTWLDAKARAIEMRAKPAYVPPRPW